MAVSINKMTNTLCGLLFATMLSALIQPSVADVAKRLEGLISGGSCRRMKSYDSSCRESDHNSCNGSPWVADRRRLTSDHKVNVKEVDSYLKIEGANTEKLKRELNKLVRTNQATRVTPAWLANFPREWRNNYIASQDTSSWPRNNKPTKGKSSEGKSSEGKSSEGKSSEGKSSEGKSSEGKSSKKKKGSKIAGGFDVKMNDLGIVTGIKIDGDVTKNVTDTLQNMTGTITTGSVNIVAKVADSVFLIFNRAAKTFENFLQELVKDSRSTRAHELKTQEMANSHSTKNSTRNQDAYFKCMQVTTQRSVEDIVTLCGHFQEAL